MSSDPTKLNSTSPPSPSPVAGRLTAALLCGLIAIAFVGFFVGINDGVPHEDDHSVTDWSDTVDGDTSKEVGGESSGQSAEVAKAGDVAHAGSQAEAAIPSPATIAATSYDQMRRLEFGPTSHWNASLVKLVQPEYDLFAEFKPDPQQKAESSATRASRRAFNGAPPIIPHEIENTDAGACYLCHGRGMRIGDRQAHPMSHPFLANCTQCHAPLPPKPFAQIDSTVANSFVGLPAPAKGERAFPGAPPTIPHSTWMRDHCLACHGGEAGWPGMESTHPWRTNCQQCHAPSARLEQGIAPETIGFLPEPVVTEP